MEIKEIPTGDRRLAFFPIWQGACIGLGAFYLPGVVISTVFLWILVSQGVSINQVYVEFYKTESFTITCHVIGFVAMSYGGYWSAKLSSRNPVWHAFIAGILVSMMASTSLMSPYELPIPSWSKFISVVCPTVAYVFGALWFKGSIDQV